MTDRADSGVSTSHCRTGATLATPGVLLVGVTHRTPGTARRLLALLRREEPVRVLVEVSPASLAYRRGPGRDWRRRIEVLLERTDPGSARAAEARDLTSVLEVPGELRAALRYVRTAALSPRPRVILTDLSRFAVPKLEEIDLWAAEVVDRLERGAEPALFAPGSRGPLVPSAEELAELAARDGHSAAAIRRTAARHADGGLVQFCGHEHLAALVALLADLEPRTARIDAGSIGP